MKSFYLFALAALATTATAQQTLVVAPVADSSTNTERATIIPAIPADAPLVSPPLAARDLTIELVGNSTALVRDARRVTLQNGPNRLRLVGVPTTRTNLGLSLSPRTRILRELGQRPPAFVAAEKFDLEKFIGQKITILRPVGNDEKTSTGTLLSVSPLLLDTGAGVLLNPTGQWILPGGSARAQSPALAPDDAKSEPEWILGAPRAGEFLAEYRYQLKGLSFAPSYTATLSGDRVRLEGTIAVQNDVGDASTRDLRGAALVVADGTVRFASPVNLTPGANSFGFISTEAPLKTRFSFRRRTPFEQSFQNQLADRSVFIENTAANELNAFLPIGRLTLNRTQLVGGVPTTSLVAQNESWGGFRPGGQIDLPLGPSDTVRVSRTVTSRLLNPVTREWTVELSVKSDQTLALSENLPDRARFKQATPTPSEQDAYTLRWILPPSADATIVRYVVETPA